MLVNGVWTKHWDPVQSQDKQGRFIRETAGFRNRLSDEQLEAFKQAPKPGQNRFRLYVGYICPWASRTLIARSLLGLEDYIDVVVAEPEISDLGWCFSPEGYQSEFSTSSEQSGIDYMYELYLQADPNITGRATIPVLWDQQTRSIVNNESSDIVRIFNEQLRFVHQSRWNLYPDDQASEIDAFNDAIYHRFNNGVYRAGFAQSQQAYKEAIDDIFQCLDEVEARLATNAFVMGDAITESDIRLFVTLARFDVAYYGLFKTNRKRIVDYPNLSAYLERLLDIKAFSKNTKIDHIKRGYSSVKKINPAGIVPEGPILPWFEKLAG